MPLPIHKGDTTVVKIKPIVHREQLDYYKMDLIERIVLHPSSKPMKTKELTSFLHKIWQPKDQWYMTLLALG